MGEYDNIRVEEKVRDILKWPTDTAEIDYRDPSDPSNNNKLECPHTIIVFFPGNPGLVGWYVRKLNNNKIVRRTMDVERLCSHWFLLPACK